MPYLGTGLLQKFTWLKTWFGITPTKRCFTREDILNLHRLDDEQLEALVERLEECELYDDT